MQRQLISAVIAVLLLLASVSGGVVAQQDNEEDSLFEEFTGVEGNSAEDSSRLDMPGVSWDATENWADRLLYGVSATLSDRTDAERAQNYASATAEVWNNHSQTLTNYTDARVGEINGATWDTIAVEFQAGDATATRYLVSEYANDTFSNGTMVNSTDRSVDKTIVVEDSAAASAAEELEYFATEYAAEDRDIDMSLMGRMQAYADNVDLPAEVKD